MKRHPRHIMVTRKWPERYFSGLSKHMRMIREKELLKRRITKHPKLSISDRFAIPHKSKWTLQFHKMYPGVKFNKTIISKLTGIPRSTMDTVYNRGLKAWKTGGSRVGATAQQWAIARLYKFILITKRKVPKSWYITKFDPDNNLRRVYHS